jgi:Helix-hairpin-helix motif
MAAPTQAYACLLGLFLVAVLAWALTHPRPRTHDEIQTRYRATGLRIDVNTDDPATLTLLPGVGPGIAEHIVKARRGGTVFHDADDLQAVKFIGPKLIRRIDPWAVYAPGDTPSNTAAVDQEPAQ